MALVYEPGDALCFRQPFKGLTHDVLRLTNKNNSPVAFKVKTTAPKQYCVRPNAGRIEPGDCIEVQVVLQPMKEEVPADFKCRDKFLIQSIQISPEIESLPMSELWSMAEKLAKDSINEKKLRVRYLPAPSPKQEEAGAEEPAAGAKQELSASPPAAAQVPQKTQPSAQRVSPPSRPLPGPSPLAKAIDDHLDSAGEESNEPASPVSEVPNAESPSSAVAAAATVGETAEEQRTSVAARRLFPESNAPSPADTTSYADAPSSTIQANGASKAELEKANSTIANLQRQISEYKSKLESAVAVNEKQQRSLGATPRVANAQTAQKTVDGFSLQSVMVVALVAFLFGYFFF